VELKSKDSTQQQRESTGLKYRTSTCVEEPGSISVGRIYGDAQDFGEALAVIGREERKAHYLAIDLPQSDDCFVMALRTPPASRWR
jgi:hypothetical protein